MAMLKVLAPGVVGPPWASSTAWNTSYDEPQHRSVKPGQTEWQPGRCPSCGCSCL